MKSENNKRQSTIWLSSCRLAHDQSIRMHSIFCFYFAYVLNVCKVFCFCILCLLIYIYTHFLGALTFWFTNIMAKCCICHFCDVHKWNSHTIILYLEIFIYIYMLKYCFFFVWMSEYRNIKNAPRNDSIQAIWISGRFSSYFK